LKKQIDVSFRNPWFSLLEGVLSRSDSKVADLVLLAWKEGAIFDTSEQYVNISFGSQHGKAGHGSHGVLKSQRYRRTSALGSHKGWTI